MFTMVVLYSFKTIETKTIYDCLRCSPGSLCRTIFLSSNFIGFSVEIVYKMFLAVDSPCHRNPILCDSHLSHINTTAFLSVNTSKIVFCLIQPLVYIMLFGFTRCGHGLCSNSLFLSYNECPSPKHQETEWCCLYALKLFDTSEWLYTDGQFPYFV